MHLSLVEGSYTGLRLPVSNLSVEVRKAHTARPPACPLPARPSPAPQVQRHLQAVVERNSRTFARLQELDGELKGLWAEVLAGAGEHPAPADSPRLSLAHPTGPCLPRGWLALRLACPEDMCH